MKLGSPALAVLLALILFGVPVQAARAAAPPRAEVRGVSDPDLRQKIQQAVGEARAKPNNKTQARRRAEDASESAAEALRSEGYYAFTITPDVSDETPPQGVLKIDPGPRFKIAGPTIDWVGAAPDPTVAADALKALGLKVGQPGRAPDVLAAEGRVLAQLKKRGYADAKAEPRRVVADYATDSLTPTFRIAAGPLVKLDGVSVSTKGRTHRSWVQRLAPWRHGQAYTPDTVAELERRLNDTGVYQSVTVALAPPAETQPDGLRPVDVTLVDRAPVSVQLGASYSTAEGFGAASALRFYNRLGMADTVSLIANVAQIETLLGVQLSLPHVGQPDQTLIIEPDFYIDSTNAFDDQGERLRLTLKRRLEKTSNLTFGVSADQMRSTEYANGPSPDSTIQITRDLTVLAAYVGVTLDNSDNPLNPTRGWRLEGSIQPTLVTGQTQLQYVRALGQIADYVSLDRKGWTVLAGRIRLGSLLDATVPDVPAPLRFYSGGGGSVRGYDYQGIGPHFPNGAPEGGAALFETSLELRQRLFGNWGMAAFVEGGSLSRNPSPEFNDVEWAVGIGARYYMGFGPVRADIGFPLDHSGGVPSLQIYLGLGQAF